MVNKETLSYLHGAMFNLKDKIKTANEHELYAIGSVLEDIAVLIHILEGNENPFKKGESK